MSQQAQGDTRRSRSVGETGLDALRQCSAFRGPVESLDDHEHGNDHLALVYESRDEQFAAVVPYIRQGLERGERCVYITHENSRETVTDAMRKRGIDVDDALESGALSIHDEQETYLRTGSFDPADTLAFLEDAIAEANEEYDALRVTGEMSFILGDDPDADDLLICESKANYLFQDADGMALCQYNRERFSPEVIRDVINTHPHLMHGDRVSRNAYYTPPSEFLGPDRPAHEVDRMLGTLREQTDAKADLEERQRFEREQTEIIADTDRTFEEKLQALFELGRERFDLELGAMARVDTADDWFEVERVSDDHEHFEPGVELPLSETYCTAATEIKSAGSVSDPREEGYDDVTVYREFGIRAYLGTYVEIDGGTDRTFFFVTSEPRDVGFSDDERAFLQSMGQWVKYELERRQRERDLRERTEHLSALVETTPECIKTVGADGTLLQMNPAGLEMVEAESESAVVGECVYDLIAPEHRESFREFNERICGGERETLEFDVVGLDGTRRHMESHAAPLHRPDGTTVHVALTRDVTEQVEREAELERTIEQLKQSNDRLQQFAYAASHDLQEPLRMISSYLQLLENRYADELDEDATDYIEFAVDGADRMRLMVDDLLAFSRVEQSGEEFEPVDGDAVIERVTENLRMQIEESGATLTVDALPTVTADREQLEQLFGNLVSNAIKYSGDDPPAIEISVEERPDCWEFAVADDGIGIDPEKTDRIFEVFKRLHHEDEYPGTGIGLSLCQEIVENHGGSIWVESEPGEGATFSFTLAKQLTE
ncbi:MEDS domain-containing protein [Haloterrigena alkaliphila]|uniref:histidine kinase n=1 Tax=Haloterrigena alkaliphila TaxID=2816475 RepID=A0A8A2V8I0_9EURY|nr:MEDS domain-containing protein [Haloterrigena alkaliphila]QSW97741.1 MEDS domain-containing protein [Haloterrigena alkaliphila]